MRYDCRFGQPHDTQILHETPRVKWEVCKICTKRFRFNKGYKGRIDNLRYLEVHIRQFCQPNGKTKRTFNKLYKPETCIIIL